MNCIYTYFSAVSRDTSNFEAPKDVLTGPNTFLDAEEDEWDDDDDDDDD